LRTAVVADRRRPLVPRPSTLEDVFVRLTGDRGTTESTPPALDLEARRAGNQRAAAIGDDGGAQ